jgi:predicted Zn finger-like uncharacterized protein
MGRAMGFLDMSAEIGNLAEVIARASDSTVMILTCPECATGYFVEDGQIRAGGRAVRCAACGARWTAYPEGPLELVSSDEEGALAKEPEPDVEPAPLTGEDLPRVFRSRAEEEKRTRQAVAAGAIWAGAAVAVAVVIGAAILFRESVVRAWPQTASAYAAIGLPVNPTGLVIEQIHAEPSLDAGHATLAISGVIRNVVGHDVVAPPLRISLLNAQGKRVAGQIDALGNARIPPGETRHFVTSIVDPPFSAANLQVDFAVGAAIPKQRALQAGTAAPAAPALALRGPASPLAPAADSNAVTPAASPTANTAAPGR